MESLAHERWFGNLLTELNNNPEISEKFADRPNT